MRNKFVGACVLLASLHAAPALAQDFDGPYVGVQAGWERKDVTDPETDLGAVPLDGDRQAFTGGFFTGYDRQVAPRIVVGAEAGMDFSADDSVEESNSLGLVKIDPKWSLDLTARAGYLVKPDTLAYVRAGYSNARVETSLSNAEIDLSDSENRDGWLAGAGIERKFLENVSGRLEYRYSDLSEGDDNYDRHRVLAGLTYRF